MAKYCANCGSPIEDKEKFCSNCGAQVDVNHTYANNNPNMGMNNNMPPIQQSSIDNNLLTVVGFFCLFLSMFSDFGYIPVVISIILGIYLYTRTDSKIKKYGKYLIVLWIVLEGIAFIQGFIFGFFYGLLY